jgi:hypothetical protein
MIAQTISASFYGEQSTFTASTWEAEEVSYIRNSDEAYIFYSGQDTVLESLGSHFDSMILIADDRTMVLFTNCPLSDEQLINLEDASITFDRFEWVNYGVYEVIDPEAE